MLKRTKGSMSFLLFASPWLIGFMLLMFVPMVASLIISLTKWDILTDPQWIGIKNYITIFKDPLFYKSLRVTLLYTFLYVPLHIVASLTVAMLLNRKGSGINLFRTIFYLPSIISSTAVALLWAWIFHPEFGLLNSMLNKFGIMGPGWIFDEQWVMGSLLIMSLWSFGGGLLIYLSGLQSIPTELYEVAQIDGANKWHQFIHVTLPCLSPILLFTTLTGIIGALQTFSQAYVMTSGGPNNASLFYAFYVYNHAFVWHKMGIASALAWIMFVLIFLITGIVLKFASKRVYYTSKEDGGIL